MSATRRTPTDDVVDALVAIAVDAGRLVLCRALGLHRVEVGNGVLPATCRRCLAPVVFDHWPEPTAVVTQVAIDGRRASTACVVEPELAPRAPAYVDRCREAVAAYRSRAGAGEGGQAA